MEAIVSRITRAQIERPSTVGSKSRPLVILALADGLVRPGYWLCVGIPGPLISRFGPNHEPHCKGIPEAYPTRPPRRWSRSNRCIIWGF
jgi:hypothetical protein